MEYGFLVSSLECVVWEQQRPAGTLRDILWCLDGVGTESGLVAVGAVVVVAQRVLASIGGDRRAVWIKELGQTVQAKSSGVVNL